jgi:cobalt-zinc-cadmium efflux system membrane fusion protein
MDPTEPPTQQSTPLSRAVTVAVTLAVLAAAFAWLERDRLFGSRSPSAPPIETAEASKGPEITLSESQVSSIKTEPVGSLVFPQEIRSVGNIDFNQDRLTQVFTQFSGRIIAAFATVGQIVKKNDALFTLDSPDLLQAESTLISAAGVLDLTTKVLERQANLVRQNAAAQKDYEQAVSDQQTAQGAYRAAREAIIKVFNKSDAELDRIVAGRKVDPVLTVSSPITGLVTARNAAPGLFVQPGNPPPVYIVADTSVMWMIANVPEREAADVRVGEEVAATVSTFPGKVYRGKIDTVGANIDMNTRRVYVRSEIADPNYDLRAGMFANFVITIGPPRRSLAVPQDAVVRLGDGTMTVWVTRDKRSFRRRIVQTGQVRGGFTEIIEGLSAGELVVTDGALFISNQYENAGG